MLLLQQRRLTQQLQLVLLVQELWGLLLLWLLMLSSGARLL
jgi:hypothetical protein